MLLRMIYLLTKKESQVPFETLTYPEFFSKNLYKSSPVVNVRISL